MRVDARAPVILLLAHARHDHVLATVSALQKSRGFDNHQLVVVIDGAWPDTVSAVKSVTEPLVLIETQLGAEMFPRHRILKNLQIGLSTAFDILDAPYCVVIEDDIVVSRDFLSFIASVQKIFRRNHKFRAVNGFSRLEPSSDNVPAHYMRTNYGVGWGWALPRKSYRRIKQLLLREGDNHWDSLIEPYLRTGFVVSPGRSRVENIGFDGTGAHSGSLADAQLGAQMSRSKIGESEWVSTIENLRKVAKSTEWRDDAIPLDALSFLNRQLVYATGTLLTWLSRVIYRLELNRSYQTGRKVRNFEKFVRRRVLTAFAGMGSSGKQE